jgi:hypothetical protein
MEPQHFQAQIKRLNEQWKGSYSNERCAMIWLLVKELPNDFMVDTCNYFLGYLRKAPLCAEFDEQIARWKDRQARNRCSGGDNPGLDLVSTLKAAERAGTASKASPASMEYARACVKAVVDKVTGRMTRDQFWNEALPFIDEVGRQLKRPRE